MRDSLKALRRGRCAWFGAAGLLAALVSGCASTVAVRGAPEQTPLVQQHSARVLVSYTGAVRAAESSNPLVRVHVGAATVARLDQAFAALFSSVAIAPDWPPWRSEPPSVEGVIEVDEGSLVVLIGNDSSIPDQVAMHYHACLYRPDATRLQCWEADSQASRQRVPFELAIATIVGGLAEQVISDAVAKLMRSIEADPAVQQWVTTSRDARQATGHVSSIALLGWPLASPSEPTKIEACLRREIAAELPGAEFVGSQGVRASLYPLVQHSTQPQTEQEFAELMARADVQARLRELGAAYLVAYAGGTDPGPVQGLAGCSYSGCLGFLWRSENSRLEAVLWNLMGTPTAQSASAVAKGTTVVPVFLLPVPLPAHTLEEACTELGRKVSTEIRATAAPPPTPVPPAAPEVPPAGLPRTP
jgi:hypothetical protein